MIHHSGGLLPLLSDCNMDKCGTCLQMPAHLNEQRAQKNDSFALYIGPGEFKGRVGKKRKHHIICAHLDVWTDIRDVVVRNKRGLPEALLNTTYNETCV